MVSNALIRTSLNYLPLRRFERPCKKYKYLNLFFSQFQSKCCSEHSKETNTDIFDTIEMQKYMNFLVNKKSHRNCQPTEKLIKLLEDKMNLEEEMKALENLSSEGDKELEKLIHLEKKKYSASIQEIKNNLCHVLVPLDDENDNRNVEIRVEQGIGGEESRLFSEELLQMYINYANFKNWEQFRDHGCLLISGDLVFGHMKYEAGVHRVQRVPETEKTGRTHTSTCSVLVMPQPKPFEVQIQNKDLIIEKTKSSGPGGQNVNKRETCIRIKHIPTGIVVENQTERFQYSNLKIAIDKLRSILFNMEREKILQDRKLLRKKQAGLKDYADKIRTYHFSQNRVTDHRINYTTHNIRGFLEGNKDLDWMIHKLREFDKKNELLLKIQNTLQSEEYKNFEKNHTS